MDGAACRARVRFQAGRGRTPTLVLGGFVPGAVEQVFLLRRHLQQAGDLYYFTYSTEGFSIDLICAQLDDLVSELGAKGRPPVVFGVSFGAGVVIEWLRRARQAGQEPQLAGLVLVSPVACVADVIAPGATKPSTLVGRALKPYLDDAAPPTQAAVEKSRAIFRRMFEAGAQNKAALRMLMSADEVMRLRDGVMSTIDGVTPEGAVERVQALREMTPLTAMFSQALLPLTTAPTLVLFAEREDAVLDENSPTRFALERAHGAYFDNSRVVCVRSRTSESPVQHASLIFHAFDFLPYVEAFYRRIRGPKLPLAA